MALDKSLSDDGRESEGGRSVGCLVEAGSFSPAKVFLDSLDGDV